MSHPLLTLFKTCLVATNQGSFYNKQSEELAMLVQQHSTALVSDRNLYTAIAFTAINDANKLMIVRGLLATGNARNPEQNDLEWNAIVAILDSIRISAVLRFFLEITESNKEAGAKRLNNSRIKRLGRYLWLTAKPYQVIKYAKKYEQILRRSHIAPTEGELIHAELYRWVSGKLKHSSDVLYSKDLRNYLLAKEGDREALKKLPLDQAQGIATNILGIDLESFRTEIANESTVSSTEKMRLQAQTDGATEINWRNYDLMQLIRYGRDHQLQWNEIYPIIQAKAKEISSKIQLPQDVALIVDTSLSMIGSGKRKGYPIAFAEAIMRIFLANETPIELWLTREDEQNIHRPLMASGATDLRTPLARAILAGKKHIVIVSDGYENQSENSINQIANLKVVKAAGIKIHHINPVSASEIGGVRSLGETIYPLAISGLEQIPVAGMLKHFESSIATFESFLRDIFRAIEAEDYQQAFAIATFQSQPIKLLGEL